MRTKTKPELIHRINVIDNNFMLGFAAVFLFGKPEAVEILDGAAYGFVPKGAERNEDNVHLLIPIHDVTETLRDRLASEPVIIDFRELILRWTLADVMGCVKEYCDGTGQRHLLLESDWYNFARLIRNALTHDGILRFDKAARPPVAFQQWRLDVADEGKSIAELDIPSTSALRVLDSARVFVQNRLE